MYFDTEARLIKYIREKAGLTQEDLAKKLGYRNSQIISNIERAICALPPHKMLLFARITGCRARDIKAAKMQDHSIDYNRYLNARVK